MFFSPPSLSHSVDDGVFFARNLISCQPSPGNLRSQQREAIRILQQLAVFVFAVVVAPYLFRQCNGTDGMGSTPIIGTLQPVL